MIRRHDRGPPRIIADPYLRTSQFEPTNLQPTPIRWAKRREEMKMIAAAVFGMAVCGVVGAQEEPKTAYVEAGAAFGSVSGTTTMLATVEAGTLTGDIGGIRGSVAVSASSTTVLIASAANLHLTATFYADLPWVGGFKGFVGIGAGPGIEVTSVGPDIWKAVFHGKVGLARRLWDGISATVVYTPAIHTDFNNSRWTHNVILGFRMDF